MRNHSWVPTGSSPADARTTIIRKIDTVLTALPTRTLLDLLCEVSRMVPDADWPMPETPPLQVIHPDR
jgi:hypothetical protein